MLLGPFWPADLRFCAVGRALESQRGTLERLQGRPGGRLGVFESTGGLGVDYDFFGDTVRFGAEIFDFSRKGQNPHLKAYGRVSFASIEE